MRVSVVSFGIVVAALFEIIGCNADRITCPAILHISLTRPDTTTIKVGAATIVIAGAAWGGCESGPPPADFVWTVSDSAVARVTPLDSLHASVLGRRPGVAVITPRYRDSTRVPPPSVTVTVVP